MQSWCRSLVVSFLLAAPLTAQAPTYLHSGSLMNASSGKPIAAEAKAFSSEKRASSVNGCPSFDGLLNSTNSAEGSGKFTLRVASSTSSYTAVYCLPGYYSRVYYGLDNSKDATPVEPDPVILLPSQQVARQEGIDPVDAAYLAIRRSLSSVESNLYYLSNADEGSYYKALDSFSSDEKQALMILRANGAKTLPTRLPRPK